MTKMRKEVLSQASILKECLESNIDNINKLKEYILVNNIKLIEIASRGSSNNACYILKYLLESNTDIKVSFINPSTITLFEGNISKNNNLLLAVSQGGQGQDLQLIVDNAKNNGIYTVSITNDIESPLAKKSDYHICLNIPKEEAMAATKSFTSEMLILASLAYALMNKNVMDLLLIESIAKSIFSLNNDIESFAHRLVGIKNCFVLGRGYLLGIAKEMCCKLQETCFINASGYATSDFLHGPFAMIDSDSYVVMLVNNDKTLLSNIEMLERLDKEKANVFLITENEELANKYNGLLIPTFEGYSPFTFTFTIQLIICYLTELLGTDPDNSRNLNKYTVTI